MFIFYDKYKHNYSNLRVLKHKDICDENKYNCGQAHFQLCCNGLSSLNRPVKLVDVNFTIEAVFHYDYCLSEKKSWIAIFESDQYKISLVAVFVIVITEHIIRI